MTRVPNPLDALTSSLLDRLTDLPSSGGQKISELRKSVRRDLENLLNTRWRANSVDDEAPALEPSLVNYGIPDFSGGNLQGAQEPERVRRAVERAIEMFEPRLRNLHVRLVKNESPTDRTLRFQIEAVLFVEPWKERVRFNTLMESGSGKVTVQQVERT